MKNLFKMAVALLILAGCMQQEQVEPIEDGKSPMFTASFEDAATKTFVDSDLRLFWTADDCLSIFTSTYNQQYRFMGNTGDNAGDFEEVKVSEFHSGSNLDRNYAVYPYAVSNGILYDGTFTCVLPAVQAYARKGFGLGANTMVAVTQSPDDYFLAFKNVCGYLVVKLYGEGSVRSIELKGNNGEKIAGVATVAASYDQYPVITMSDIATETITIDCGETGTALGSSSAEATEFWFCIPPVTFSKGFTMRVTDTEGKFFEKGVTSSRAITRNVVNSLASLQISFASKSQSFDENSVVASFGVMSDVHIQSGNNVPTDKFKSALSQLKTRAAVSDVDGLDGILIAGDMIQTGCSSAEITTFKDAYKSVLNPSAVPLVYCLGNHDVTNWWTTNMVRDGKTFRDIFRSEFYGADVDTENGEALECRHARIRGVNVLTMSPIGNTPVRFDSRAMSWLDSKLAEITAADPESYVFILLHAMIQNTVYGSNLVSAGYESADANVASYWYTSALTSILNKYPQAVTFSGHLHFPINDPRSIWQGGFTALGCGSVRYMAFEGGSNYVNKSSGTVLNDSNDFSQGYLLQVDASGNARFTRMDFFHNQTIGDAWEIPFPDPEGKSHLDAYSYNRRVAENQAPELGAFEVVPLSSPLATTPCTAKWEAARDEEFAHHYELTWTSQSGSKTVWIMSDYYRNPKPDDMMKTWEYSLGAFPAGTYSATLVAVDPWGKSSAPVTTQFTVEQAEPVDPGTLPDAYVNLDFDGTMRDVNGKVSITNFGGSVTSANVTVGGMSRSVPAFVTTSKTSYALCQFKEFTSAESMKSLMAGGFTVEAFYVDKDKSDGQTHGVVCGTEYGGWGLAETKDRMPYFIVGYGARNTYKSVYATSAASASELTHVVATYDPSSSKLTIYINGALQATTSFSSTFFPGEGDAFNRFCLGADVTNGNKGTHYPSTSMVIADAKIYTTALNATQAALAFDKAKKDLGF